MPRSASMARANISVACADSSSSAVRPSATGEIISMAIALIRGDAFSEATKTFWFCVEQSVNSSTSPSRSRDATGKATPAACMCAPRGASPSHSVGCSSAMTEREVIRIADPGSALSATGHSCPLQHDGNEKPCLDDPFSTYLAVQHDVVPLEKAARRIQPLGRLGKMFNDGLIVSTDDPVRLEDVVVDVRHQRGSKCSCRNYAIRFGGSQGSVQAYNFEAI